MKLLHVSRTQLLNYLIAILSASLPTTHSLAVNPNAGKKMSFHAEWKHHHPDVSTISPPRSGHTSFVTPKGDAFVFGGYAEINNNNDDPPSSTSSPERFVVNDLWKWKGGGGKKSNSVGWTQITDQSGDIPQTRLASASSSDNNYAYLFGGWDPQTPGTGGVILDSVHKLDLNTMKWTELEGCTVPDGPTSRHVALTLPKESGVIMLHNHRCKDHVLLFDTNTESWRKQKTNGEAPSPRGLHTATILGGGENDHKVVFFGGAAQDGTMSNEVHLLDTSTWTWTKLSTVRVDDGPKNVQQQEPCPRASPCLCSLNDGQNCIVFGGAEATSNGLVGRADLWLLSIDVENKVATWTLLQSDEDEEETALRRPPGRNAATMMPIFSDEEDEEQMFVLHGGWAPFRVTYNDVWTLHVSQKRHQV